MNLVSLKAVSDKFFKKCSTLINTKPWAVCIAMHEYTRNLYPSDPYIPFPKIPHTERLYKVAYNLIEFLAQVNKLGRYKSNFSFDKIDEVKQKTGEVYGKLWAAMSVEQLTNDAYKIIKERLIKNDFNLDYFKGIKALDIGCGSGRFTFALKKFGCGSVIGIDYGDEGLKIANFILKKKRYSGIKFLKHDVIRLPFKDEEFDFIFNNGVLHHTKDMKFGIKEMIRVAKKGAKIWFFVYGDGGIFWYARKKIRSIMKKIPQDYTMSILRSIGMPQNRFIFCDTWYVPLEEHTTDKKMQKILRDYGINKIKRLQKGRSTDLLPGGNRTMWGDGELRYILEK